MTLQTIHLFGEIDISFDEDPEAFFKRACLIAEQCGYIVTKKKQSNELNAYNILIDGEDFNDDYILTNYVNVYDNKISSLQKVIFSHKWIIEDEDPRIEPRSKCKEIMHKVYTYHKITNSWNLSFNADKFRIDTNQPDQFTRFI